MSITLSESFFICECAASVKVVGLQTVVIYEGGRVRGARRASTNGSADYHGTIGSSVEGV